jgi:hypothetical protein
MRPSHLLVAAVLSLSSLAWAQTSEPEAPKKEDKKLKGSVKQQAPKLDLGLPTFEKLPTGEGLTRRKDDEPKERAQSTGDAPCTLVSAMHSKVGAKGVALTAVPVSGAPPTTERFATLVRVKCPTRRATSIEVSFVDARGEPVMEASGSVGFRGGDESDWSVDWEPSTVRGPGDYALQIKLGGVALEPVPVKFEAKK